MSNKNHIAHAALGAISILAIGVVVGVWLARAVVYPAELSAHTEQTALALESTHETYLEEMRADLGFTDEQASQVHEILSRHQSAVNEAWQAVHERLEAAIDSVTLEIESILEPEERSALHEWLMERHGLTGTHGEGGGH